MKKILIFLLLITSCNTKESEQENTISKIGSHYSSVIESKNDSLEEPYSTNEESNLSNDTYSFDVFETQNGWGYQINKNENRYIIQNHIPSIPGIKGFTSKEKAAITAKYILEQVEKGNFPPTVNRKILDSLKVI